VEYNAIKLFSAANCAGMEPKSPGDERILTLSANEENVTRTECQGLSIDRFPLVWCLSCRRADCDCLVNANRRRGTKNTSKNEKLQVGKLGELTKLSRDGATYAFRISEIG
jgi:hypothetical protein